MGPVGTPPKSDQLQDLPYCRSDQPFGDQITCKICHTVAQISFVGVRSIAGSAILSLRSAFWGSDHLQDLAYDRSDQLLGVRSAAGSAILAFRGSDQLEDTVDQINLLGV